MGTAMGKIRDQVVPWICLLMLLFLLLAGCAVPKMTLVAPPEGVKDATAVELEPRPVKERLVLAAVGDIMMHDTQIAAGLDRQSNTYDFSFMFASISRHLKRADVVFGNLETTLAGKEFKYTGYPLFNAPEQLAANLKEAGFTILSTANNHSLDRKAAGVERTLEHLDRVGLAHVGTARTAAERDRLVFQEVRGIKLAFLAYTYGTNGIPVPKDRPYLVNLIDLPRMVADIQAARAAGADMVVVSLHIGNEYQREPNPYQRMVVEELFRAGAGIVLGSHPHVLQPMEWRQVLQEDGSAEDRFVVFSLGNFVSAQKGLYRESSAILYLTLEKDLNSGHTRLVEVDTVPVYTHKYRQNGRLMYRVVSVEEALAAYRAATDPFITAQDSKILEQALAETRDHFVVKKQF